MLLRPRETFFGREGLCSKTGQEGKREKGKGAGASTATVFQIGRQCECTFPPPWPPLMTECGTICCKKVAR